MGGRAILQCFNVKLKNIQERLTEIRDQGYTDIQISPVQSHCSHIKKWYRLYQPTGNSIGNSLGSEEDLEQFIKECQRNSLGVIVDVVLNHTTGCPLCNPIGSYNYVTKLVKKFLGFEPPSSRFDCNDFGPRVNTDSKSNFTSQLSLLQRLVDLGVSGFRFDAAKHIRREYLAKLLKGLKKRETFLICYSECLDGDLNVLNEYIWEGDPPMMVIDFTTVFRLISALGYGGDLRSLQEDSTYPLRSIAMADCHDSKIGDSYHFGDDRDGILAVSFLLGRGTAIPLVWDPFSKDDQIKAGMKFYHECHGLSVRYHWDSTPNLLIIMRGDRGIFLINKSNEWMEWDSLNLSGMRCGRYRELVFNFEIYVEKGSDDQAWVQDWCGKGGFKVGPRQALFLIHLQ